MRAPSEIGGPAGPVTERVEVAAHRRPVEGALLGLELVRLDERLPRGRPELGVGERASSKRRFDTANRASAGRLASRLPPACSRASRRRHMSSARRSIAGVTRGATRLAIHARAP